MLAIAERLAEKAKGLFSGVEIDALSSSVEESGHDVAAVRWAIREHLKAGRMTGRCRQYFPDKDNEYEIGWVEIHDENSGRTVKMPSFHQEVYVWGTADMWVWLQDSGQEQPTSVQQEEEDDGPIDGYAFRWRGEE